MCGIRIVGSGVSVRGVCLRRGVSVALVFFVAETFFFSVFVVFVKGIEVAVNLFYFLEMLFSRFFRIERSFYGRGKLFFGFLISTCLVWF